MDARKNFAYGHIDIAPADPATGTVLTVLAADVPRFPTPPFNATIWPANSPALYSNAEIVRVTALVSDGTATILRNHEGSASRAIQAGDQIAATVTQRTFDDLITYLENVVSSAVTDRMRWCGAWSPTVTYQVNDVVRQGGELWVCKVLTLPSGAGVATIKSNDFGKAGGTGNPFTLPITGLSAGDLVMVSAVAKQALIAPTWADVTLHSGRTATSAAVQLGVWAHTLIQTEVDAGVLTMPGQVGGCGALINSFASAITGSTATSDTLTAASITPSGTGADTRTRYVYQVAVAQSGFLLATDGDFLNGSSTDDTGLGIWVAAGAKVAVPDSSTPTTTFMSSSPSNPTAVGTVSVIIASATAPSFPTTSFEQMTGTP